MLHLVTSWLNRNSASSRFSFVESNVSVVVYATTW